MNYNTARGLGLIYRVITLSLCLSATAVAGPLQQVTVFQQGESGYHTFRIPAIVQANDGTLLAFAEGRVNSPADGGNIDLLLKRSFDGGATWGPLQLIYNNGSSNAGNPAPVVDQNTGNIILPFVLDDQTPVYKISTNNGATWSSLVNITSTAKLPTWDNYAIGPVHGIQLERGPHAGRLVIPCKHTLANHNLNPDGREAHVIYSDDGGVTWHVGGVLTNHSGEINPNESTVVELTDGSLNLNCRNQGGLAKARLIGYSTDSGETFNGFAQVEYQLIDPVVEASLLRYSAVDQGDTINRILFSNPASEISRVRMTIKSSFDETATWNTGKLVYRGPSGYSDMVRLASGGGILYENGTSTYYNRISFARFDTEWLDDPSLMQIDFRDLTANDQRGNGLNGVIEGNPSFITGDPRYGTGHALHFDGQNDMVRIDDTTYHPLDFDASDSFTLEAVFRTTSHTNGGVNGGGPMIAKDVDSTRAPQFWMSVIDSHVQFLTFDGDYTTSVTSNVSVSDGQWHHVAVVFNRQAGTTSLYIDYTLADTDAHSVIGSLANATDLLLGACNVSAPDIKRFQGDIDLARISMGALSRSDFVQPDALTAGDANGDGLVNLADLQILGDNWQSSDACWVVGDFTGDGIVNQADLQILGDNWSYGTGTDISFNEAIGLVGIVIPEPLSLVLVVIGVPLLLRRNQTQ